MFVTKEISYHEALPLRSRILKPFLKPEECINPGDLREGSFHFGVFFNKNLVGIASYELESHPYFQATKSYRLRGMASDPECRRQGIGRRLIQAGERQILNQSGDLLWFNARLAAFPFYEKLGFKYSGELFDISQIGPHKVMYKSYAN